MFNKITNQYTLQLIIHLIHAMQFIYVNKLTLPKN